MLFNETGNREHPTIILLHGGGLSEWSWKDIINSFKGNYHIITVIIDGHGSDVNTFVSIEDSACKLVDYIDTYYHGRVFAIAGLSIGAQIITEVLSLRTDITEFAIIESALVYPIKGIVAMTLPIYNICYGLIRKRWFSKLQSKTLNVPQNMFETYYQDSLRISKESLINITLSNGNYSLKDSIAKTEAQVLIIVGSKELGIMKKSANLLHQTIDNSELYVAHGMKHGEISLVQTSKYIALLKLFFTK